MNFETTIRQKKKRTDYFGSISCSNFNDSCGSKRGATSRWTS